MDNQERAKNPEYPYRKGSLGDAVVEQMEVCSSFSSESLHFFNNHSMLMHTYIF